MLYSVLQWWLASCSSWWLVSRGGCCVGPLVQQPSWTTGAGMCCCMVSHTHTPCLHCTLLPSPATSRLTVCALALNMAQPLTMQRRLFPPLHQAQRERTALLRGHRVTATGTGSGTGSVRRRGTGPGAGSAGPHPPPTARYADGAWHLLCCAALLHATRAARTLCHGAPPACWVATCGMGPCSGALSHTVAWRILACKHMPYPGL
jgi:hypothetical protein